MSSTKKKLQIFGGCDNLHEPDVTIFKPGIFGGQKMKLKKIYTKIPIINYIKFYKKWNKPMPI